MKSKILKGKRRETLFIIAVLSVPMILFLINYVYINSSSIFMAFLKMEVDFSYTWNGLNNFREVFAQLSSSGQLVLTSLKNSLRIFFWTLVVGFPLNMIFSFYLYKKMFAHSFIRFVVMLPSIVSGLVIGLLFLQFVDTALPELVRLVFKKEIGNILSDPSTSFGVLIFYVLWTGFSSSLILYPNAMNAIPTEIIESAKLDGVNSLQELWYIIMPLIYPTITTFMVTGVAGMLVADGPLFLFYYTNAPAELYTMGYYLLIQTAYSSSGAAGYPFLSALGLVLTLIAAPITIFVKYMMEKYGPDGY